MAGEDLGVLPGGLVTAREEADQERRHALLLTSQERGTRHFFASRATKEDSVTAWVSRQRKNLTP